jgi:uncharacterized phiE125 gp8 family phage protein
MSYEDKLYSLIPLEDFKAVIGIDDREDKLARFCLVTATYTIEQYCKRRLLTKGHFEDLPFWGDRTIPLTHYPVQKVLAVYLYESGQKEMVLLEPDFYSVEPECGTVFDTPASLVLSFALRVMCCEKSLRVVYKTGYAPNAVPADLATACLELAAWNMNRYRGRRIGMMGNVRGNGKEGEHFEMSMPANVCQILEPYRRKVI